MKSIKEFIGIRQKYHKINHLYHLLFVIFSNPRVCKQKSVISKIVTKDYIILRKYLPGT